jgi:hypothetical protein
MVALNAARPNQTLERTATRRVFTFQMIKAVSIQALLAISGGRSAWTFVVHPDDRGARAKTSGKSAAGLF